jgi:folate-binding protein YgfZ
MPLVAYPDAALTIWQGKDALKFIDGLSTNKMVDLEKGHLIQTVFTSSQAKIIDFVTVFHMGEVLAVQCHQSKLHNLLNHVLPRILSQDVSITDVTERNQFAIEYGVTNEHIGTFVSLSNVTYGHTESNMNIVIASKENSFEYTGTANEFDSWRIENLVPWNNHEITTKNHPLAAGLGQFVHPAKGCYIGQEILARMVSRGRQGKNLVRCKNTEVDDKLITTRGDIYSLGIVRTNL